MVNVNFSFGREKTVAVIDVSEGGAGVSILNCPASGPSTVLAEARSQLVLDERPADHAAGIIGQQIQEATDRALKLYTAAGRTAPIRSVYIFLHAPWATSRILHSAETYEEETYISDDRIAHVAQSAMTQQGNAASLIESSVIHVRLNGYPTPQPTGKYAHSIDVVSLATSCDSAVQSTVKSAVEKAFPVATIVWRSALRAAMAVAGETMARREYVVLDMSNEITSIASIRETSIEQFEVQEGVRSLLARVSAGKSAEDALSSLRMLARDACTDPACEAIQTAIATAEPELVRVFGEIFGKIAAQHRIANELFLLVHPDVESWMTRFFSRLDFGQFTVTSLPFIVLTAASLDLSRWIAGSQHTDSLTVCGALVNIENAA